VTILWQSCENPVAILWQSSGNPVAIPTLTIYKKLDLTIPVAIPVTIISNQKKGSGFIRDNKCEDASSQEYDQKKH